MFGLALAAFQSLAELSILFWNQGDNYHCFFTYKLINLNNKSHAMLKHVLIFIFCCLFVFSKAQQIQSTDAIQNKAVIVLPSVSKAQLELLKTEFAKFKQIKKAVFVYKVHNCLLLEINPSNEIIFYSDLMKIISQHVALKDIILKESKAYDEIYSNDFEGNAFILK